MEEMTTREKLLTFIASCNDTQVSEITNNIIDNNFRGEDYCFPPVTICNLIAFIDSETNRFFIERFADQNTKVWRKSKWLQDLGRRYEEKVKSEVHRKVTSRYNERLEKIVNAIVVKLKLPSRSAALEISKAFASQPNANINLVLAAYDLTLTNDEDIFTEEQVKQMIKDEETKNLIELQEMVKQHDIDREVGHAERNIQEAKRLANK